MYIVVLWTYKASICYRLFTWSNVFHQYISYVYYKFESSVRWFPEWWICYIKEYFDLCGILISLLFKILGVSGFFSIEVEHFVVIKYFLITRKNWKNLISSMFCQHHFKPSLAVMVSALPVHILKTFFSLLWK